MNTAAGNRHRVDLIHAEKGTSRNSAGGGRIHYGSRPKVKPSGRRAELRTLRGVEGGRRIA